MISRIAHLWVAPHVLFVVWQPLQHGSLLCCLGNMGRICYVPVLLYLLDMGLPSMGFSAMVQGSSVYALLCAIYQDYNMIRGPGSMHLHDNPGEE